MAEDTVSTVAAREGTRRQCCTAGLPLAGADGLTEARAALAEAPLAPDQLTHLVEHYGSAALEVLALIRSDPALGRRMVDGLPVAAAEVVYACRAEIAVSLTDCLYLRTRLAVLDAAAADTAASAVATLMTRELGWDAAEGERQHRGYGERRDRERVLL
jgi:glycerol-3-phosphate dehydrogenase